MRSDLDPIKSKRLSLLGAHQLTLTGIKWVGEPSDEEYAAACALDGVIRHTQAWLEGDLITEWVRREKHKRPGSSVRTLVSEYATRSSQQFDACYERFHVAITFTLPERATQLTWSHHRVVWAHGGESKATQLKWLAMAADRGWDVRALSAAIMAKRPTLNPQPTIPSLFPLELQGAVDWVSSRLDEVATLSPSQAAARAEELAPVIEYHARCKARALIAQDAPNAAGLAKDGNVGVGC